MIQFVQAGLLAGLVAVAIPLVIHLFAGRRGRLVHLGTLRFLEIALRENVYRRKLKRWLLLMLRMCAVVLLVLLFARPFIVAGPQLNGVDNVVILIDRSASMSADSGRGRPLDRAVDEAQRIVAGCREDTRVFAATFEREVFGLEDDADIGTLRPEAWEPLRQALANLGKRTRLNGATNYGAALMWAHDVLLGCEGSRRALYILTDLQRSGLDEATHVEMPEQTEVRVIDVGQAFRNNMAATRLATSADSIRPGEAVTITASIFNGGAFPSENLTASLRLVSGARQQTMREEVHVENGETKDVAFTVPQLAEGLWTAVLSIEVKDDLLCDNERVTAILVAPPQPVLLIDGDPGTTPTAAETFFLDAALRLAVGEEHYADTPFDTRVVNASEAGQATLPDLSGDRVVVMANVGRTTDADARKLADYVNGGGGLCVFAGDRVTAEGYRSWDDVGISVGRIGQPVRATVVPWRFDHWESEHLVFQPFADPEHGDLTRVGYHTYLDVEPDAGTRVLAWFQNDRPAMLEKSLGRGKIVWLTASCDRDWGDWPRSRLYVPLLHQMLGYLVGRAGGGPIRHVTIGDGKDAERDRAPGVYQRDACWDVVNLDARESDLDRVSQHEFADLCGLTLNSSAEVPMPTETEPDKTNTLRLRESEIWHWLALGLMGVLSLEFFLANRTSA